MQAYFILTSFLVFLGLSLVVLEWLAEGMQQINHYGD